MTYWNYRICIISKNIGKIYKSGYGKSLRNIVKNNIYSYVACSYGLVPIPMCVEVPHTNKQFLYTSWVSIIQLSIGSYKVRALVARDYTPKFLETPTISPSYDMCFWPTSQSGGSNNPLQLKMPINCKPGLLPILLTD